jgi:Transglycosylase SLT domain
MAGDPDFVEPNDVDPPGPRGRSTVGRLVAGLHPVGRSSGGTPVLRYVAIASGAVMTAVAITVMVAMLMVLMAVGGGGAPQASATTVTCAPATGAADAPPANLVPIYQQAAEKYKLGYRGWAILAAINRIETRFGTNVAVSSKGAVGWMQFLPDTWRRYGVDTNGDGVADPNNPEDAIYGAANYLAALLKEHDGDWSKAIFGYNPADWYVDDILTHADAYQGECNFAGSTGDLQSVAKVPASDEWLQAIQGTKARCDARIVDDVLYLLQRFNLRLGDCYAPTGHTTSGEHPLGLAVDVVPADGNWDNTMAAAHFVGWREDCAARGCPNEFARWIGYNGVADHGDPQHCTGECPPHLHISWNHAPAAYNTQAAWVMVWNVPADGQPATGDAR